MVLNGINNNNCIVFSTNNKKEIAINKKIMNYKFNCQGLEIINATINIAVSK